MYRVEISLDYTKTFDIDTSDKALAIQYAKDRLIEAFCKDTDTDNCFDLIEVAQLTSEAEYGY